MKGRAVTIKAYDFAGRQTRLSIAPAPGADGQQKVRISFGNDLVYVDAEELGAAVIWLFGKSDAGAGKHGRDTGWF